MRIERFFEMPSIHTFQMPKLRKWTVKHLHGRVLNVFGGITRLDPYYPGEIVHNDLNEDIDADFHYDALEINKYFKKDSFDTIILDPPYSFHQIVVSYNGIGVRSISRVKNAVHELIRPEGTVITFGYNSTGMGKKRGYKKTHLLLVNSGAGHNDIIVVVERKVQSSLLNYPQKPVEVMVSESDQF